MSDIATNAREAYERYETALAQDAIIQGNWHEKAEDGRQLACALGVIGANISRASDCPGKIMPRWLAQMVPWLFDGQAIADALPWGKRFYEQLARLDGAVPFSVIHDWQANAVGPLAIEADGLVECLARVTASSPGA